MAKSAEGQSRGPGPLFLALTDLNAHEAERLTTKLTDYIKPLQVK